MVGCLALSSMCCFLYYFIYVLFIRDMQRLLEIRGPIEDPSSVARANRSLILDQTEGLFSYTATCKLITASKDRHPSSEIDVHWLSLLKVNFSYYGTL